MNIGYVYISPKTLDSEHFLNHLKIVNLEFLTVQFGWIANRECYTPELLAGTSLAVIVPSSIAVFYWRNRGVTRYETAPYENVSDVERESDSQLWRLDFYIIYFHRRICCIFIVICPQFNTAQMGEIDLRGDILTAIKMPMAYKIIEGCENPFSLHEL